MTLSPIRLCFKEPDTSSSLVIDVSNVPANIAPLADFFKGVGVRNYYNVLDLPNEILNIRTIDGSGLLASKVFYLIYRDKGVLTMIRPESTGGFQRSFAKSAGVRVAEIDLDEIQYYKSGGTVRYEQMISGSGGGENSYGGAIVGGLLFGTAGAIIGSRANDTKTEIRTQTITHDDRTLVMCVKRNSILYNIQLELASEPVLDWLIPEKQYDYVIQKRREMFETEALKRGASS